MLNVLITGGLGYIGAHIIAEMINKSYKIIILDNLSNSNISVYNHLQNLNIFDEKNLVFYHGDLLDTNTLINIFSGHKIDIVIHNANLKSNIKSIIDPLKYYHNNISGTIYLLSIMKQFYCRTIIFTSSACIYNNNKERTPYSNTKHIQEEILHDLYKSDNNWNIVIIRCFYPVSFRYDFLVSNIKDQDNLFFKLLYNKKKLILYNNFRDYIHIIDVAKSYIYICKYITKNKYKIGLKIYNLGSGNIIGLDKLINKFQILNNTRVDVEFIKTNLNSTSYYADINNLSRDTGWKLKYSLDDMLYT
jgi:UDP-glucose 4-epimerase